MQKKRFRTDYTILWLLAAFSIIVPFFLPNKYFQDIAVQTFLWAGLASSWNIYSGYCGRLSIGHAAYFGIGAYASTILYLNCKISPWIGILAGIVLSAAAALLIGGVTLRLRGTFFVLSTVAFAEILKTIVIAAKQFTAGSLGLMIPYIPGLKNMIFVGKLPYACLAWCYMMIVLAISVKLEKSRLGYSLIAVGQDQEAAESLGVDSTKTMMIAYIVSAIFTSVGGTIFAQYMLFIEPNSMMSLSYSVNFILFAIAGGMGMAFGPMIGSWILVPLSNLLRGYLGNISGLHGFVLGLLLVIILLYRPDGILPQIERCIRRKNHAVKN